MVFIMHGAIYAQDVERGGGVSQFPDSGITLKLNAAYALVGVVNPQLEFRLTPHSAFQTEFVYSPWRSINGKHMHFGIFLNEYRYYVSERTKGFYVGANVALKLFDMSKPTFGGGRLSLQDRYCKGSGVMAGAVVGYEHRFAERWVVDIFAGFGYSYCWYNGYTLDNQIDMYPSHAVEPTYPDPYNVSAQWLPTKVGVSIGFLLNRPE
jgi:hypothetical protein